MNGQPPESLPAEVERVVREVLESAGLEMTAREEVARELRAHFEDGLAAGVPADELIARFGDPIEAGRRIAKTRPPVGRRRGDERRGWMGFEDGWTEVMRAARRLTRAPGFAAIVMLTLGLGVGANTAIFTVLEAVLLDDLPYPEPERLVRVYEATEEDPAAGYFLRAPMVAEARTWDDVFAEMGTTYSYRELGADLTDADTPRRVTMGRVSHGYFEALGVPPSLGRTFTEEESFGAGESSGSSDLIAAVVVLSHDLWTDHFAGDPRIVGTTVQLDGASFEVVGVMPDRFSDPFGSPADVWIPQDLRAGGSNSLGNFYLSGVARLRDGVGLAGARERVRTLTAAFEETNPDVRGNYLQLEPLQDDVVGSTRATMLWILAAAGVLVLLTACLNVANLILARGLRQDRPLALQSALGAGRARLLASVLAENGLLATGGGVVGLLFGWLGLRALTALAPDALPRVARVEMGTSVFMLALGITVFALLAFGLVPALRLSRTAPAGVLRSGDRSSTSGRLARRLRDGLVVFQVAAALVLVIGATLLTRSFTTLAEVPLAVEGTGVLTYEVHLPTARYPDGPARHAFHERLHDRVAALPAVEAVGATSWLPLDGRYHIWGFTWSPETVDEAEGEPDFIGSDVRIVAGDYFRTLGVDLVRGADLSEVDLEGESVVWINQNIVDDVFGDVDPIGAVIDMNGQRRVVGIVESTPYDARGAVSRKLYVPHAQYNDDRNWALIQTVRARGELDAVREAIRAEITALDGQLVLYRPQSFEAFLDGQRAQDRFATVLMGAFALLALLVSLLGTYGVLAGSVAARTREFGIRMALGADTGEVRAMVLRYATAITLPGIAVGLVGAWAASRWIEALLFGVESTNLGAYATAVGVFLAVGALSALVPAMRATKVDTVQALTAE